MAMEYIRAFLVGGLICMLVQILMDKTKMMPGRIMVLLVVSGSVLGFLGVYEPFAEWAGAGATVPLLGFGNTLWKGVVKAMAEDGVLGIFKGGFTASAVGISGALVFGFLRLWSCCVCPSFLRVASCGAPRPSFRPTPAVYWHACVGCFCLGGTKRRGSLWKSKKYLEFFKRYCYGENLYVKTLFEK